MLRKIGQASIISSESNSIDEAEKLILPGVGHFDHGMKNLSNSGLIEALNHNVLNKKKPILGICLGAQLLGDSSEEGVEKGLGWIPMQNVKFNRSRLSNSLKIPHMGWNKLKVKSIKEEKGLFYEMADDARFYFVHSFHMLPTNEEHMLSTSKYGYEFVSSVQKENIYGVQFHPEKSHHFGMQLLKNFAKL